jgi:hypothetical protein
MSTGGFSIEKNSSGHNELFSADFNGDLASDVIDEVETAAKAIRPQRSFAVLAEARDRLSKIYAYRSEEKEREFTTHGVFLGHYLSFGLQRKEQERFYDFKATMNDNKFLVCKVSSENQSRATVVIPSLVISVDNIVRAEEECRKTVDMLKPYQQMILDFNKDVMGKKNG